MARRAKKRRDQRGLAPFTAGLIAVIVVAVGVFFAFTKANPFASPYELKGAFESANNLKPNSPVRIAGVEVGKVKKVEAVAGGSREGAAIVTMHLKENALPIHEDAQMKIRPRVFLEGNFFVDVKPGSPSAKTLASGKTIPTTQTAAPVQFGDVLTALQSDTRADLQVFLKEYS
jgi:ABC-type transporter Mla subunit MlaD